MIESDVWVVRITGRGEPPLFLTDTSSNSINDPRRAARLSREAAERRVLFLTHLWQPTGLFVEAVPLDEALRGFE
jgi:hypothetical protein